MCFFGLIRIFSLGISLACIIWDARLSTQRPDFISLFLNIRRYLDDDDDDDQDKKMPDGV